ncbi:MAG: ComEC/Rec2 family competence protein [Roseivirga sp.]|nr:ComEC/Rec2 family competence protein [Roseivirga sp.]
MFFNKSPFLRLTFPFILGIVSYHYLGDYLQIGSFLPICLFIFYMILWKINSLRFNPLMACLAIIMLFSFGFLRLQDHRLDSEASHILWQKGAIEAYEGIVIEEPVEKARSVNLRLNVKRAYIDRQWQVVTGLVNLYVSKEAGDSISYGDWLLVKGAPEQSGAPSNPGEFDFANYLVYNNMFHQQFAGNDFVRLGGSTPNLLKARSIQLRKFCKDRLVRHIDNAEVRSVMLAIVLGIKNELDNDLQGAFSASGAMHVLAVSGLHVGIIYAIILLSFKWLRVDQRKGRWWIAIISILALWCYAFLTGLSPSVLRAVTMFSFIALAKAMNRNGNIYNTLAASAFLLLWYNPYLIMSVGFQLSYLAVFGIVYLQPKFYQLFTINNYLLDKIWAITCVSLAAQVATAPLSMLYFHQFPTYFLISNLFIIPAAFIMLIMGLFMLVFSSIPFVGEGLGWLIEIFVQLVNTLVYFVRDLPGSTLEGIRITTGETWLVYTVFIFLILLFYKRRFSYLILSFGVACVFAISQIDLRKDYLHSSTFRLLDVSNTSVADFRYSSHSRLLADSIFKADQNKRRFHFEPGRLLAGSNLRPEDDKLPLVSRDFMGNKVVCFRGETFFFLQNPLPPVTIKYEALTVDHLVVSHNAVRDLDTVVDKLDFGDLLIDTSNKSYVAQKLIKQAARLDLTAHSIQRHGYFEKLWND